MGIVKEIESQRKFLYKLFGESLMRPYFQQHYHFLRRARILVRLCANVSALIETLILQKIKEREMARFNTVVLYSEMIVHMFLLILMFLAVVSSMDQYVFNHNNNIRNLLEHAVHTNGTKLSDINSVEA